MTPTDSCWDNWEYGINYDSFLAVSKQGLLQGELSVQDWNYVLY